MTATTLDHLVYGTPDLLAGVRLVHELTGVEPVAGGQHPDRGTANCLIGLGDTAYLEIIGPNPDDPQPLGWFGLDHLHEARLLTWAVRTTMLDECVATARAAGYDPGDAGSMSRRTSTGELLSWRLTPDTVEQLGGVVPFLIDWGDTRHPANNPLPRLSLVSLTVHGPHPRRTSEYLAAVGAVADVEYALEPGLRAVLETPTGRITLD